jgi:hypothetical protein
MLSVLSRPIMLSVIMLSVIMLSVVMLSVGAPEHSQSICYFDFLRFFGNAFLNVLTDTLTYFLS